MDVLDIAYAPGVPAATPGAMRTDELFDVLYGIGKGMDFFCLDPRRDTPEQQMVKASVYAFLTTMVSQIVHI